MIAPRTFRVAVCLQFNFGDRFGLNRAWSSTSSSRCTFRILEHCKVLWRQNFTISVWCLSRRSSCSGRAAMPCGTRELSLIEATASPCSSCLFEDKRTPQAHLRHAVYASRILCRRHALRMAAQGESLGREMAQRRDRQPVSCGALRNRCSSRI